MSREVVQDHSDLLGLWVVLLNQAPHRQGELSLPAALGDRQLSPATQGLEAHQNPADPSSLVLRIEALDAPRLHRQGISHIAYELAGTLVEADHRSQGVVGFFVEVQNLFHPPHESRALPRRDHPLTFEVRLELVFLSVRLTVS